MEAALQRQAEAVEKVGVAVAVAAVVAVAQQLRGEHPPSHRLQRLQPGQLLLEV